MTEPTNDSKPRVCEHCGKELPPGTRPNKRFCSAQCRNKARYLNHHEEWLQRANSRYHRLKSDTAPVTCKYCGKEFTKEDGRQIYCSVACKRRMASARAREKKGLPPMQRKAGTEVTCPVCGKTFLYDAFGQQKYCSKECSAKAQKEYKRRWNQLNRKATADKPPAPKPEPKPVESSKTKYEYSIPYYPCLKPVKPPPPPPPPPEPEWRPWILENRQPTQAEMDAIFNKYFG